MARPVFSCKYVYRGSDNRLYRVTAVSYDESVHYDDRGVPFLQIKCQTKKLSKSQEIKTILEKL